MDREFWNGWRLIKSAPRCSHVEILATDYDSINVIHWAPDGCGQCDAWEDRDGNPFFPCYWQPLPDVSPLPMAMGAELPPGYIDPEHAGGDRKLLEVFYTACRSESGTADEIYLRGIRAVLVDSAGDLLAQQGMEPVPVSERHPGAEDCAPWPDDTDPDTQPWCWLGNVEDGGWVWHQRSPGILDFIRDSYTHWLPAHALPLPSEEVQ